MIVDKQRKILLVEDEVLIGLVQIKALQNYGYQASLVLNGRQAIDRVINEKDKIALILMDIDLGNGLDGTETARIILEKADIPILFLSNHSESEIVKKTEDISSYGYVVKSAGIAVLDASIKTALRLERSYRKLIDQQDEIGKQKTELEPSEKRYRRLFESAKDGILILDAANGKIVDVNPYLIEMLGFSKEEFLNRFIWEISPFKDLDYSRKLFKELQEKEYVRYIDLPLQTIDNNLIHVEFVSNVYLVEGERVVQCNIRDISERKVYEKDLINNIDQKNESLRELQHRIKNSFNMISNLIYIRSSAVESKETKSILKELNYRIRSISELYSLLYETKSINKVDLKIYCCKIIESMTNVSQDISINQSVESILVPPEYASVVGMILIELISNSIKYAFDKINESFINLELIKKESKIFLTIEDNGCGLSEDFDLTQINSMGFRLVSSMVAQLQGIMEILSEKGTKIMIQCPL